MAGIEEEALAPSVASPTLSDHKRKLEDSEPEAPESTTLIEEHDSVKSPGFPCSDSPDAKRPRLDEEPGVTANANGYQDKKVAEPVERENEPAKEDEVQAEDAEPLAKESEDVTDSEKQSSHINGDDTNAQPSASQYSEIDGAQLPSKEESEQVSKDFPQQDDVTEQQEQPFSGNETMSRKIEVPNNKVGVLIGKAGDTIRYLQYNSGAKIQIVRDADADLQSPLRPVELVGSLQSINKAEKLIRDVIAEADAGGSPSLVARGVPIAPTVGSAEQVEMKVPNEKVGLIIGKGGETIKGLQTRSGARIQLIPQHLPEGGESKERIVRVTGDKRQIEVAREMIKDVMRQPPKSSPLSSSYSQQAYRPRGPGGPPQWGPRAPYSTQPMAYDYQQRGLYQSQTPQYAPPPQPYGGYPQQQMHPRSGFGPGWDQRAPNMPQGPAPHGGGYDYYGSGHGGHAPSAQVPVTHSAPVPGHLAGQSTGHGVGPQQPQASYHQGQPQGAEYGHPGPYSMSGPSQQSYGHGYEPPKYDSAPPATQYGGSQPIYPQAGAQSGYAQNYGKPPPTYGMQPPSYGTPRPNQSGGEMAYQASNQVMAPQQQQQAYPYPSSEPMHMQQSYPMYGSTVPSAEASGAAHGQPPQGTQHHYQQAPAPATGGYSSYPAVQQGYPEQQPTTYQDGSYGSAPTAAYGAAPAQPVYDQSGYGGVPQATAPATYGKTVSPQPGYPQYDTTTQQPAYGAPR